jgi:hypothetical protein
MASEQKLITDLAVIANDISYIKGQIVEIKQKLEGEYVTHDEFEPVKKVVYGLVSLILVAVVGALLGLVIFKP